jgi:hypothetical protein
VERGLGVGREVGNDPKKFESARQVMSFCRSPNFGSCAQKVKFCAHFFFVVHMRRGRAGSRRVGPCECTTCQGDIYREERTIERHMRRNAIGRERPSRSPGRGAGRGVSPAPRLARSASPAPRMPLAPQLSCSGTDNGRSASASSEERPASGPSESSSVVASSTGTDRDSTSGYVHNCAQLFTIVYNFRFYEQ